MYIIDERMEKRESRTYSRVLSTYSHRAKWQKGKAEIRRNTKDDLYAARVRQHEDS